MSVNDQIDAFRARYPGIKSKLVWTKLSEIKKAFDKNDEAGNDTENVCGGPEQSKY